MPIVIDWKPIDNAEMNTFTHPLWELIHIDSGVNINAILNAIPVTKLTEVEKMIKELQAK
jgi:hypothetical protein